METKSKLKIDGWLLPGLTILVLIVDLVTPYRGWRVLFAGLGLAWLISYLWARSLAQGLHLTREMRFGWAQVGDRMVERFTLENKGWAPAVWVEVRDESTMPDYQVSRSTGMPGRDAIRWHTEAECNRRGLFMLGPTRVETSDPFGIYSVTINYPATMPLLVLPPIVPLPSIEVAPGGRSGDGRPRANAVDRTVSAAAVREYQSGDSRRWIHWRTSARRDDLYVRLFDGTPAGDWWVILDMNHYVKVGKGANSTEEHGVVLAASLADRGIRMRRSVGLVAHGKELVWQRPEPGEGHRWELLRSLALITSGDRSLDEVLTRIRPSLGRRSSIIIITPSVDTAWVEALVPIIRRGIRPTVLLLDPISFGGTGNVAMLQGMLSDLGVANYRITQDVLDRPELRPGKQGQWEWRVLGTGKAIPVRKPAEVPWKELS